MPIADDNYITADQVLFEKLPETGRTLIQAMARRQYPIYREAYCGDRDDLEQAITVGFLEWLQEQPDRDKLRQSVVCKVLERAAEDEYQRNLRGASLGQDDTALDEDGNPTLWNPADPYSDHPWNRDRVKQLDRARLAIAQLVGSETAYMITARAVHELSWDEISYRCSCNKVGMEYRRSDLGWPQFCHYLSPLECEALYEDGLAKIKERYSKGDWKSVMEAIDFKGCFEQRHDNELADHQRD